MNVAPRFCPFCREPFEGIERCPDHGLVLVPFFELRSGPAGEETSLSLVETGHGRGSLAAASVLLACGSALPFVREADGRATSLVRLFQLEASYLAVVPFAALLSMYVLLTRRTRRDLGRARVGLVLAYGIAALAVGVATYGVHAFAAAAVQAGTEPPSFAVGAWLVALGALVGLVASARLGR